MITSITIVVKSAVLLLASNINAPELYCVVSDSVTNQEQLYRNPEGGCQALGRAIEADVKKEFPQLPVLLEVDGVSTNRI